MPALLARLVVLTVQRSWNLIRRIKFRRVVNLNSKCSKHEAARPHDRTTTRGHGGPWRRGTKELHVIRRYTDKQRVNCSTQYLWLQRLITLVSDRNTEGLR